MTTTIVDNVTQSVIAPPITPEHKPWYKCLDETQQWHSRFVNFYLVGSRYNRSILQAYRVYRQTKDNLSPTEISQVNNPPHSWYDASANYNWQSRAASYDAYLDRQLMDNLKDNAVKAKAKRIQMIDYVMDSVMEYYASGEVKYDSSSANATLKTVLRESREEYQPTTRHDSRTQIIAFIGQLPNEVQAELRGMLKKATD